MKTHGKPTNRNSYKTIKAFSIIKHKKSHFQVFEGIIRQKIIPKINKAGNQKWQDKSEKQNEKEQRAILKDFEISFLNNYVLPIFAFPLF